MRDDPVRRDEPFYLSDAVFRLEQAIARIGALRLRRWSVTLSSYAALRVLERQPKLSLAQLSRRCYVQPQTMTRIIAELERRGYVQRGPNEDSDRAIALTLTGQGIAAVREMGAEVDKIEATLSDTLGPHEAAELSEVLRRSAARVEAQIKEMKARP